LTEENELNRKGQADSEKHTRQIKEVEKKLEDMTSSFEKLVKEKKALQEQNNQLLERLQEEEERFRSRAKKNDDRVCSLLLRPFVLQASSCGGFSLRQRSAS